MYIIYYNEDILYCKVRAATVRFRYKPYRTPKIPTFFGSDFTVPL